MFCWPAGSIVLFSVLPEFDRVACFASLVFLRRF